MAKAGMRRPDPRTARNKYGERKNHFPKNSVEPVPEIQGKAKHGKAHARPVIAPTSHPLQVYHQLKGNGSVGDPHSPS